MVEGNERTVSLDLTAEEIMFLKDNVRNSDTDTGYPSVERSQRYTIPAIDILGIGYLETVPVDAEGRPAKRKTVTTTLFFNEPQLRLFSNRVRSGDQVGSVNIGVNLTRKIIKALLVITDPTYGVSVSDFDGDKFTNEHRSRLQKGERNAPTEPDSDQDDPKYPAKR